jgi:hypothetical protein
MTLFAASLPSANNQYPIPPGLVLKLISIIRRALNRLSVHQCRPGSPRVIFTGYQALGSTEIIQWRCHTQFRQGADGTRPEPVFDHDLVSDLDASRRSSGKGATVKRVSGAAFPAARLCACTARGQCTVADTSEMCARQTRSRVFGRTDTNMIVSSGHRRQFIYQFFNALPIASEIGQQPIYYTQ